MKVFRLDGTAFKFQKPDIVEAAKSVMESAAYEKYQQGRTMYLTKHLGLAKNNNSNFCKSCDKRYNTLGNRPGQC